MTAMTAVHQARAGNPPLPFTRKAIIDQLRRQATNGPAYVQHSATKTLARLKGMFDEAKLVAKQTFQDAQNATKQVKDQAADTVKSGYSRVVEIQNGAKLTEAELRMARVLSNGENNEEDDEDGSANDKDEPP